MSYSVATLTAVLGACDSHVSNLWAANGCTITDNINKCASDARNVGATASCSAKYLDSLVSTYLSDQEKGRIQGCVHALKQCLIAAAQRAALA